MDYDAKKKGRADVSYLETSSTDYGDSYRSCVASRIRTGIGTAKRMT